MEPSWIHSLETYNLENEPTSKHNELVALSRISAALNGLRDLNAILRIALETALNIIEGTVGGVMLLDEQNKTLSYRIYHGLSTKYAEEMHVSLGEGIAGKVAESGKLILLEDISSDPNVTRSDLVNDEQLKAFISVPLRAKDRVLGVINIASHTPHRFTTEDVHILHLIADQLGVAIEQSILNDRLRMSRERLRKLTRQNLEAEEEERRRIARELHDETSQSLTGIVVYLQAILEMAKTSSNQNEKFMTALKKVQSLTVQAHKEVSRIISDLHPALLDTLGLIPAIQQYAETRLQPLKMNVSIKTIGIERRLTPDVETALFRFVQGAIGNIAQHSKARNVTIVLEYRPHELSLNISDDGLGFIVSEITDIEKSGRGRGLFSMKERIGSLSGISGIKSETGVGTNVWAKVPICQEIENVEDKSTDTK